jgi:formylglycine-generating enzyme required for sulfatase activity
MFGAEALWRLLEGQVIKDQFYLQALLGAGTYGGVFRTDEVVRDTCLRSLATKLISLQNPDQVGVQLQELQIALSLDHPNLIRCYGAGEVTLAGNAFLYLLMELAEGTLQDCLEQGPVPSEALKQIIRDVAAGLAHLHQSQQSHLDIKPGNILKVGDQWKIGDYGLVRTLNPTRTSTVTRNALGTPLYMPPESYDGILSPAWDVWSLGIMAVNLLTGQYPIRYRTENELGEKIKAGKFDNLQWDALPSPWRLIIQGCLQVNRGDRWAAEHILGTLNPSATKIELPRESQSTLEQREKKELIIKRYKAYRAQYKAELCNLSRDSKTIIENLGGGIILELVKLPAGSFLMGSPDDEPGVKYEERPQHRINIRSFAIGKYPLTQAQYEVVMGTNPSHFKGDSNHPVESVSWSDAQAFCQKLSEKTGRKYRLPSEAEWECACRAGNITSYSFGNSFDLLGSYAWFRDNSNAKTHSVGRKKPNPWGLYNMHGNVWEWCEDAWHDNYQGAPVDGIPWNGKSSQNNFHVLRGGSWFDNPPDCRSAARNSYHRNYDSRDIGIRLVLE